MNARAALAAAALVPTAAQMTSVDDPVVTPGPIASAHTVHLERDPDAGWRRAAVTSRRAEHAARERKARARRLAALAAARAAIAQAKAAQTTTPAPAAHASDPWAAIAACESGSNPATNTGNGFYGEYQFTQQSWAGVGGLAFAPRADLATAEQQLICAKRLLAVQGWGAWPACSAKAGLR